MLCIKCGASLPEGANFCHMCGKKQIPQKRKPLKRPNGSGTVYKLSGHRKRPWVATKNRVIIGYYEKKTDALQALERLSGVSLSDRFNMTFAEVYAQWSPEHFKTIGPKGVETYENSFQIFSSLHDTKFRDLRTSDFQEFFFSHWKKSHATLSKYKQLLTQMYSFAIREEIATTNFAKFISLPDQVKKEKEIFSQADIEKLKKEGSDASKIILMLIGTGMRIGELFSLPLSGYHQTYVIGGSKTDAGRNRIIPIRPEARDYFAHFAAIATGPLLLSGYSGQRVADNFRNREYYPLLKKLKIKKSPLIPPGTPMPPGLSKRAYLPKCFKQSWAIPTTPQRLIFTTILTQNPSFMQWILLRLLTSYYQIQKIKTTKNPATIEVAGFLLEHRNTIDATAFAHSQASCRLYFYSIGDRSSL